MSPRHFFFGALLGAATLPAISATAEKPNIVYILADDLGYGDVQALNPARGKIKTPHLDRLSSQGMTFTDPTAVRRFARPRATVCSPAATRGGRVCKKACSTALTIHRSSRKIVSPCLRSSSSTATRPRHAASQRGFDVAKTPLDRPAGHDTTRPLPRRDRRNGGFWSVVNFTT